MLGGAIDRFRGTKRFAVDGQLGEGGMGVVYRVRDVERGETVALKTMNRVDSNALLRFKREFRALADIVHPNVVQLYELFSEEGEWFFTMELVDGIDFLSWVKSSLSMPPPPMPTDATAATCADGGVQGDGATVLAPSELYDVARAGGSSGAGRAELMRASGVRRRWAVRDGERLRDALRQLAHGLAAIHAASKLHRDVKPSNVMVTRSGRVVLLDFGVVGEYVAARETTDEPFIGTPAYMAPEQAAFRAATPASDWYAVGVVLYEALTGALPFEGHVTDVLMKKQRATPPAPSEIVDGVPPDLERLCVDLLRVDPRARPSAEEVLRRLEGKQSLAVSASVDVPFVGRQAQLAALEEAFARSRAGDPVLLRMSGRSGMGKSTLVSRFLGGLASRPGVLVLSGRCYEREAVPFKAVDQIVDELSRWLASVSSDASWSFVPRGVHHLARLFPVLRDAAHAAAAHAAADAPPPSEIAVAEPQEVRRRAFAALKELFVAMAQRYALILHIDDMQWGDVDSVQLLEAVLSPPSPPAMLLVCGYRSELAASSASLEALREVEKRLEATCEIREMDVGELARVDAVDLARAMLARRDADDVAQAIADEAQGSPFFVAELARWANERRALSPDVGKIALDEVILARVAELPEATRSLLEVLSVAGAPLEHGVAQAASATEREAYRDAVARLRAARLVTTRGLGDRDLAETSHERIREALGAALAEERRREHHLRLARALAKTPHADPESVFLHFRAGGDEPSARAYALRAAEAADAALAFLNAARLYQAAIDLHAGTPSVLYRKLGDAFVNAGRGAKAADAYLAAAAHAPPADREHGEALELRRMAADHLLKSGREREGLDVLRGVLDDLGLRYPESDEAALASLVVHEARSRVTMLVRRLTPAREAGGEKLARIDAAFVASTGLALTDVLRGADFAARGLALALDAGEPVRLCRALAVAAGNAAAFGEQARRRAEDLVRAAEEVAARTRDPHGSALAILSAAFVHFFFGEWRSARSTLDRAEHVLRERCRFAAWELANTQAWTCNTLILSGELREAADRVPAALEEARAREDRFAQVHLVYPACVAHIAADDVDAAWRATELGALRTRGGVATAGDWGAMISACSVLRYRGNAVEAWRRAERETPAFAKGHLLRAAMVRTFNAFERGLTAVAAAAAGHERKRLLAEAEDAAKRLSRERLRYASGMGHMVRACVAAARGDRAAARAQLEEAVPRLDAADLGYLAACARTRLGALEGGARGRELVERSRAFFAAQGVKSPESCLAMSAPGFDA